MVVARWRERERASEMCYLLVLLLSILHLQPECAVYAFVCECVLCMGCSPQLLLCVGVSVCCFSAERERES